MLARRRVVVVVRQSLLTLVTSFSFAWLSASLALAQACNSVSGSPWSTCPTWTGPSWAPASYSQAGADAQPIIAGADINGDGLGDLIYLGGGGSPLPAGAPMPASAIAISTGSAFTTYTPSLPAGTCYQGNFDASGRAGVACLNGSSISYAPSNGAGYGTVTTQTLPSGALGGSRSIAPIVGTANPCFVMDVDGDGTDDIVCGSPTTVLAPPNGKTELASSQNWGVYLFTKTGVNYQVWTGPSGGYTQTSGCIVGDFNGDGLKDLACIWASTAGPSWNMLLSTGTGWANQTWTNGPEIGGQAGNCTNVYGSPGACNASVCVAGDFDGDGTDDIACPNTAANEMSIGFGGGNGGFKAGKTTNWAWANLTGVYNQYFCTINDMYGSGRDGILCINSPGTSSTGWVYAASTGTGFTITNFTTPWSLQVSLGNGVTGLAAAPNAECVFADFNGDGIKDVACNPAGNGNWYMGLSSRPK